MKIKVGSIIFKNGKRIYPNTPDGYKVVEVMTKCSKYSSLSPYCLQNNKEEIMENIWQFSKIYKQIEKQSIKYSNWDNTIIWEHDKETHVSHDNKILDQYWSWREKGIKCKNAIRYPAGFKDRTKCLGAIKSKDSTTKLNYIDSRKQIYLPLYMDMVKNVPDFISLKNKNENLFIIECDGPKSTSNDYYNTKYNIDMDIADNIIDITYEKISILLNDDTHPFGHGFCLAMSLLDMDYSKM